MDSISDNQNGGSRAMQCKTCKMDNAPIKRSCSNCGAILVGEAINNVTGEQGKRNADGSFTPSKPGNA